MLSYRVVQQSMKKGFFGIGGKLTAVDFEKILNKEAAEGWTLDRIVSGEAQPFIGDKDVFWFIFKKTD